MKAFGLGTRREMLRSSAALAGTGVWWTASAAAVEHGNAEYAFRGETMGTSYHVRIALPRRDDALAQAARQAVDEALQAVDRRMSTYRAESELSGLNRQRAERPFVLSEPMAEVLAVARDVHRLSDGAFDVTAGRFVNAWGFGPDKRPRIVPAAELDTMQQVVGFRHLALDARERTVVKADPRVFTDLSGVAKGFGVDRAAQALHALGIAHYVIETGGEVRAAGRRPDGLPWQVGVEQPQAWPQRARYALPLADRAMATSGDYRIYFERGGRRYCHEIDPSTGQPVDGRLTSVSVLAPTCAEADAWATALFVLGPVRGRACAQRLNLAAYFITRDGDGALRDTQTPAFAALGGRPLARA
jgi:thiamine biosynthesis lipoprotein